MSFKIEHVELNLELQPNQTQFWDVEMMSKQNRPAIRVGRGDEKKKKKES